jgi:hypothetical protein
MALDALQAEAVEQRRLHRRPLAHRRVSPRFIGKNESESSQPGKRVYRHHRPKPVGQGSIKFSLTIGGSSRRERRFPKLLDERNDPWRGIWFRP